MTRRTLQRTFALCAALLLSGCGLKQIRSELVLGGLEGARIDLHQNTEAIELVNDSDSTVTVTVLDRKDRVMQHMELGAREQVRLDLAKARAISFENGPDADAVLRWTLLNGGTIEYTMVMSP